MRGEPTTADFRRAAMRERLVQMGLTAPALALIGLLLILPVGVLFALSVVQTDGTVGLEHFRRLWVNASNIDALRTTMQISAITTVACALLGFPYAYLMARASRPVAALMMAAVLLPFWTSLLVRTYAWLVLLQRRGLVNTGMIETGLIENPLQLVHNELGAVIGMTHIMLPFLVLPLYASMRSVDQDLMRASASLGAGPIRAFWTVFFPLALPGFVAGGLMVFVLSLGFYITPALLGGGRVMMVSMAVERAISYYSAWGAASALGVMLLVATLAVLAVAARLLRLERLVGG